MKYYICITPFFPTQESFRGPFVYDQIRAIERNSDYKVIVFVPTSKFHPECDYEYEGIHVYRFPTIEMPSMLFNGIFNDYNAHNFIKKVKKIGISPDDIEVAHGHTGMFAAYSLALKKLNKSIVSIVQHHDPDPFGVRNGRFLMWGMNTRYKATKAMQLFRQIDIHLCISRYVEENLKSFPGHAPFDLDNKYHSILTKLIGFKPFTPKRTIVLYNGVDTGIFYPNPVSHDKFTIGCIANIGDWKNQITLLKAIKLICDEGERCLKVILIGSGVGELECRQFIDENGLNDVIEIRREVHHKYLPAMFNTFDLFVLPSFFEGFGCVFTEAAACGVPFIGCKGQGAMEYISPDDMNQWTVNPFDYKDLAHKIKRCKTERPKQKLIKSYDIEVLVSEYISHLKQR